MKRRTQFLLAAVTLLGIPSIARANMGTPLMWAAALHLLFGNFFIGLLEGLLLGWFFKVRKLPAVGVMVLANYLTAWIGLRLMDVLIDSMGPVDFQNRWAVFWLVVVATYLITLLIEFPFVAALFFRRRNWVRKAIVGSLVVQTVSYGLLFGWYASVSGATHSDHKDWVVPSAMDLPGEVTVYYISEYGEYVRVVSLSDLSDHKCDMTEPFDWDVRLGVIPSASGTPGTWDIVVCDNVYHPRDRVVGSFRGIAAPLRRDMRAAGQPYRELVSFRIAAPRLHSAKESPWEFRVVDYGRGISGKHATTQRRAWVSFETPLHVWRISNATHLPGDTVLFQLGGDQICIYDPETKQIALLAKGWGPIAVIEETE